MSIQVVILAAGQGTRMYSKLPKVLHALGGKPLLAHVLNTAHKLSANPPIVIYGHEGDMLRQCLADHHVNWVEQKQQLGTAHALMQALPVLKDDARVLVLYGDVPLISQQTLQRFSKQTPENGIGIITATFNNPTGYGRIKRDAQQRVTGIVEEKDATADERQINEINTGIYLAPAALLKTWLPQIKKSNAQQEFYLTDIIAQAAENNLHIHTEQPLMAEEVMGINDRGQLSHLERFYQQQTAAEWMRNGVTIMDPARIDIRGDVTIGRDVVLDINVILEGKVTIGNGCVIGPQCILRDVTLGDNVQVKANSIIEEASIGAEAVIGPFARIRPGTKLAEQVHIGNFVEIKNSQINTATKINHLSYVGDSEIGRNVNIGAGTITCNYDGVNKHKTIIHDDVQIGSDTQLVAPVVVGEGATVGAGSTVTQDVPPRELTLTHTLVQRIVKGWCRPKKAK